MLTVLAYSLDNITSCVIDTEQYHQDELIVYIVSDILL